MSRLRLWTCYRILHLASASAATALAIYVYRMGRADPSNEGTAFWAFFYLVPFVFIFILNDLEVIQKRTINCIIALASLTVYSGSVAFLAVDAKMMPGPVLHFGYIFAALLHALNWLLFCIALVVYALTREAEPA